MMKDMHNPECMLKSWLTMTLFNWGHPAYKGKDGECFEKMACRVKPVNRHMREQGKIKKNAPGKKKRRKLPMNTIMKCLLPRMPFPP